MMSFIVDPFPAPSMPCTISEGGGCLRLLLAVGTVPEDIMLNLARPRAVSAG